MPVILLLLVTLKNVSAHFFGAASEGIGPGASGGLLVPFVFVRRRFRAIVARCSLTLQHCACLSCCRQQPCRVLYSSFLLASCELQVVLDAPSFHIVITYKVDLLLVVVSNGGALCQLTVPRFLLGQSRRLLCLFLIWTQSPSLNPRRWLLSERLVVVLVIQQQHGRGLLS
jgi:hypothetical protein